LVFPGSHVILRRPYSDHKAGRTCSWQPNGRGGNFAIAHLLCVVTPAFCEVPTLQLRVQNSSKVPTGHSLFIYLTLGSDRLTRSVSALAPTDDVTNVRLQAGQRWRGNAWVSMAVSSSSFWNGRTCQLEIGHPLVKSAVTRKHHFFLSGRRRQFSACRPILPRCPEVYKIRHKTSAAKVPNLRIVCSRRLRQEDILHSGRRVRDQDSYSATIRRTSRSVW